ncbi:hypothetical protein [Camelimonas lactis]|uniref:Polynucleotide kinase n=1 Tax=Camelimonas lactis TaxID=659006 RepID=A0A4R2GQS0_9HYPH|nr:hypothetical protein [Camelimonas lactis]TCO12020.1 hypothetical protein EV666_11058 [Camelimonas lactis]
MRRRQWIGVDLDGTLAHFDEWRGVEHIGEPVGPMVERVRRWLAEDRLVKIFTARASVDEPLRGEIIAHIHAWLERQDLPRLEVTCVKDLWMRELWDDRAVQVIPNTGVSVADELEAERLARTGKP